MGTNDTSGNTVAIVDKNYIPVDDQKLDPQGENYKKITSSKDNQNVFYILSSWYIKSSCT